MASDFFISQAKKKAKPVQWNLVGNIKSAQVNICVHLTSIRCWYEEESLLGKLLMDLIYSWRTSVAFPTIVNIHIMPWKKFMYIAFFQLLSRQVSTCLRFLEVMQLRHSWVPSRIRGSSCFYLSYFPVSASICCCSPGNALAFADAVFGPFSKPVHRTHPLCSGWGGWWAAWSLCTRPSG